MKTLSPEKIRRIWELRKAGKSIDEIAEELRCSTKTVVRYLRLSEKEANKLIKQRTLKLKKQDLEERSFRTKADTVLLREIKDMVADESLRKIRELLNCGLFVEKLYEKKQEETLEEALEALKKERIKNFLLTATVLLFLKGKISKKGLAKRVLAIRYA